MRHFVLWFTKITGALPMLLFIRPKVCREGKRPSGKGAVVVMNHTAMLDFATVLLLFPARTVRVLMAEVLFRKGKLLSWFLRGMRGIMVERNGAEGADFLVEAARAIEKGTRRRVSGGAEPRRPGLRKAPAVQARRGVHRAHDRRAGDRELLRRRVFVEAAHARDAGGADRAARAVSGRD